MASITNTEPRLINGPPIPGHPPPQWLPGKNRLDAKYWSTAQRHSTIKRWLKLGWLKVDLDEEIADPTIPPTDEELAEFSEKELGAALKNENVPVQWHPALEGELAKRKEAARDDVAAKLQAAKAARAPRKSLTGINVPDAMPLIAAESDVDTLEAWAEADKRTSIENAIDERLAELALDGEPDDEDDDDEDDDDPPGDPESVEPEDDDEGEV